MKDTEIEQKLSELESRNVQLETNLSLLAARNSQLETGAFSSDDEIDLKELWNAIWAGKWLIIGITFIFSLASVLYALSLPDEYKSTALLAPASSSSTSQLGKLAGQFGGLASLAGINLGGGSEDKTLIAMEIIKTWGFLDKFIEDNNIQVEVFAAEGWNRATDTLKIDPDLYNVEKNKWVRDDFDVNKGQTEVPSSWELYEEFSKRVSISQDKDSGLISLTVEYYSPILAQLWCQLLVKAINSHVRKQEHDSALKNIKYLEDQIKKTNIAEMRSVFFQLIEEQTKTIMFTEVNEEYVFKTLSEPKVAEEESKPNRAIICVFVTFVGGSLAILIAVVRFYSQKNKAI